MFEFLWCFQCMDAQAETGTEVSTSWPWTDRWEASCWCCQDFGLQLRVHAPSSRDSQIRMQKVSFGK